MHYFEYFHERVSTSDTTTGLGILIGLIVHIPNIGKFEDPKFCQLRLSLLV